MTSTVLCKSCRHFYSKNWF